MNLKDQIKTNTETTVNGDNYRLLIQQMIHGFALLELCYDENRAPYDCRFVETNPTFMRITKKVNKNINGKTVRETFPGTEYFWIDQCGRIALTGKSIHFKNYSKLFGRIFDVVAYSPQKGQFAVIFKEITKKIGQNKSLPEDENNFRALAENAYDGILISDEKGMPVYANPSTIEITGYSFDELKNSGFKWLRHSEESGKISGQYQTKMVGETVRPCCETIIVRKNGEILPIELSTSKTVWYGQPVIIMIFRDISQRKRHKAVLPKKNRHLEKQMEKCAIELSECTAELMGTYEKLRHKNKELLLHKSDLEKANKELVQVNTALSVLARNIDKKKDAVEKKIAHKISSQLIPIIEEVKRERIPEKSRVKLDVLNEYLKNLAPGVTKAHDIITSLSSTELRVAIMIKNGFSSADIARLLYLSPHTVKTHRRSIRRKLNIRNTQINLASYLKFKLGKVSNGN
jgi:PAS domain S-box-containing protein